MLYQLYETQRSLMEPFTDLALSAAKVYGNPQTLLGKNPLSQRISAGYDLLHRVGKDYEKPEFGIRTIDVDGVDIAIHERIEVTKPFCELRRFKRFSDDTATLQKLKNQPAVLIVAPLSVTKNDRNTSSKRRRPNVAASSMVLRYQASAARTSGCAPRPRSSMRARLNSASA